MHKPGQPTATFKVDCPFRLKGSLPTSKMVNSKLFTLAIIEGTHNHEPFLGASSHPAH
jgi:hypothetical protein